MNKLHGTCQSAELEPPQFLVCLFIKQLLSNQCLFHMSSHDDHLSL